MVNLIPPTTTALPTNKNKRHRKSTNQLFYPNPAEKTINFKEAFKGSISVYGLNGELVQESTNLNTNSYNVSDIKTGIYILKYTSTDGEVIYNKLVKK